MNPRIHYLLEIDAQSFLTASPAAPEWVARSLAAAPFVVVRRGIPTPHFLPVGVRGQERSQRWAGMCDLSWIRSVHSPAGLMATIASASTLDRAPVPGPASARLQAIPALRSLVLLANNQTWRAFPQAWGPGGSVGFELASGRDTATPESDLDVIIYADQPLSAQDARRLHAATQPLPSMVDVRVETPACGFSLTEYATQTPVPILLRTASGVLLGADPWAAAPAASHP